MDRRSSLLQWFPVLTRYGGLIGVAFVAFVWLLTNRFEPALLAFFGGMIGVGEGVDALKELAQAKVPAPPTPPDGGGSA